MPDEKIWLVMGSEGDIGLTDDLDKAQEVLAKDYADENKLTPEAAARVIGPSLDLKLGDWCLVVNGRRERGYYARPINWL